MQLEIFIQFPYIQFPLLLTFYISTVDAREQTKLEEWLVTFLPQFYFYLLNSSLPL